LSRGFLQHSTDGADFAPPPLCHSEGMRNLVLVLALSFVAGAWAEPRIEAPPALQHRNKLLKPQVGKASIYADKFANRRMANGRRMDPRGDNAASKTLPLGTRALVSNLETGRSAVVTIEDRGPYVRGRVVDLSPATAEKIGLERKAGLAVVQVTPLDAPTAE
jgi:rare lipoprotein A